MVILLTHVYLFFVAILILLIDDSFNHPNVVIHGKLFNIFDAQAHNFCSMIIYFIIKDDAIITLLIDHLLLIEEPLPSFYMNMPITDAR